MPAHAEERLAALFGVKTMEAFGNFSRAELSAGAALIAYVEKTQIAKRPPIEPPRRLERRRDDAASTRRRAPTSNCFGQRPAAARAR